MTGTGNDEEQDTVGNKAADNDSAADDSTGKPSDVSASDTPDTSTDESDELCVFVESIGENSIVGNIISMEPSIDGDNIVVTVGEGGDNKKLVSIYFADDVSYVYQKIRDGDVETREGSFSDIGINS